MKTETNCFAAKPRRFFLVYLKLGSRPDIIVVYLKSASRPEIIVVYLKSASRPKIIAVYLKLGSRNIDRNRKNRQTKIARNVFNEAVFRHELRPLPRRKTHSPRRVCLGYPLFDLN